MNSWYIEGNNNSQKANYFAEHYIIQYVKVLEKNGNRYRLYNGVIVDFNGLNYNTSNTVQDSRIQIGIFINGKLVNNSRNHFIIELGGGAGHTGLDKNKLWPYAYMKNNNRNSYTKSGTCNNKEGANYSYCFALIMYDGWKISNDYPW